MHCYLVGGAVRDELLGLPVTDRDWVVVGGSTEAMLAAGYVLKDASFGTFLHPDTGDEYSLARRERKTAAGHRGFAIETGPDVSLTDDLARRDLTVNAIARDAQGQHVAPHGGLEDLRAHTLRHVTAAFVEDPLRVLRAARFAALLATRGFHLHPDTRRLMGEMCDGADFAALSAARIWEETTRALRTGEPAVYLRTLQAVGAFKRRPDLDTVLAATRSDASFLDAPLDRVADDDTAAAGLVAIALRVHLFAAGAGAELLEYLGAPASTMEHYHIAADIASTLCVPDCDAGAVEALLARTDALRRATRFDAALHTASLAAEPAVTARMQRLQACVAPWRAVRLSAEQRAGLDGQAIGRRLIVSRRECLQRCWTGTAHD